MKLVNCFHSFWPERLRRPAMLLVVTALMVAALAIQTTSAAPIGEAVLQADDEPDSPAADATPSVMMEETDTEAIAASSLAAGESPYAVVPVDPPLAASTVVLRVSVRTGPGLGYEPVAAVAAGTDVEVTATDHSGNWVQVLLPDVEEPAWIARIVLKFEDSEAEGRYIAQAALARRLLARRQELVEVPAEVPEEESAETAPATAAVRAAPVDAVEFTEPAAADLTATDPTTAESAPNESTPTETPAAQPTPSVPTAYTQPQRMNGRSGPGLEYNVVTTVAYNTEAEILASGPLDEWYQVRLETLDDPIWLYQDLTEVAGDLSELPQLTEEEIPLRPSPTPTPEAASRAVASAPVVDAPAPSGGGAFGYGVQAHIVHTGQEGVVMEKTREMDFSWVKQQIEWRIFESQPGQYGFGDIGPIVGAANLRGVNLLFSVVNAPNWAREPGFDPGVGGPPADPQTYANFVGRLAGEYCGSSLKAIEVWNEQNLHYEWGNRALDPAAYMDLLRPAYAAIKAACPSMYVISGALTPTGDNGNLAVDDLRYLEGMFQQGLARYADGIGAHPSGYNVPPNVGWQQACAAIQETGNSFNGPCDTPHHSWSFRSTMESYRNIMVQYGAGHLRIWPTEFGWAAGGAFDPRYAYVNDNSFEEQAAWTVEAFQMMKNWGWVGPTFLWNLNFRVVANGTEKAQWGIVTNDWRPLPVFHALRDMPK